MSNVCGAEQHHHKFLSSPKSGDGGGGGAKLLFKDFIEVPPRKLLQNKKAHHHSDPGSPGGGSYYFYPNDQEMNSLHKFLPFNNADSDSDPYSSDHFRMYEFKIRRCTRSRSHDWTDCPFAHPGEKARRRDPRRYHYSGTVCSEYRRGGGCSRGDDCEFAHGVFECWLHPSRYRTEACKDGKNCKRKVCFFAHSPRQLRILPEIGDAAANKNNHCCMFCHHHNSSSSSLSSPTSTLLENMSHLSLSPPLSPAKSSPISRYPTTADRLSKFGSSNSDQMSSGMTYKDVLNELMTSLDAMSFSDAVSAISSPMSVNINPWVDANSFDNFIEDHPQQQFVLSPSTPSPLSTSSSSTSSGSVMINPFGAQRMIHSNDHNTNNGGLAGTPDPDLGWVNELLM